MLTYHSQFRASRILAFLLLFVYSAPCQRDQFRCESGGCIAQSRICDSIPDCADFSDENSKTCRMYYCFM